MKMANYLKLEDMHGLFITEMLFVTNTYVSWFYMRLYYFPRYVIAASTYGKYHLRCGEEGAYPGSYAMGGVMLHSLLVLHWFWFALMNRIGYRMITGESPAKA